MSAELFGDQLRKLRGNQAVDLTEASEKTVEKIKEYIANNFTSMREASVLGMSEHCIHIYLAYSSTDLELTRDAIAMLNDQKYNGLQFRLEVDKNSFTVWAMW